MWGTVCCWEWKKKQMSYWHCLRRWRTSASFSASLACEVCIIIHLLSYYSLTLSSSRFLLLLLLNRDNGWCLMKPLEGFHFLSVFQHLTTTSDSQEFLTSSMCYVRKRDKCSVALQVFLEQSHCFQQMWTSVEKNHLRSTFWIHELLIGQ